MEYKLCQELNLPTTAWNVASNSLGMSIIPIGTIVNIVIIKDMEKLVILDYVVPSVHVYDVDTEANIDETYIENLGFNTNSCSWMFGDGIDIIFHKEVLK